MRRKDLLITKSTSAAAYALCLMVGLGCVSSSEQETGTMAMAGTKWVLAAHGLPDGLQPVLPYTEITLHFQDDGGSVGGTAGCNVYRASYEVSGPALSISTPGSTRKYCQERPGIMEQERLYLAALASANHYHIDEDRLEIAYDEGRRVLLFYGR